MEATMTLAELCAKERYYRKKANQAKEDAEMCLAESRSCESNLDSLIFLYMAECLTEDCDYFLKKHEEYYVGICQLLGL